MESKRIDFSHFTGVRAASGGRAETEETSKAMNPSRETRPQSEKERHPDYHQRRVEKEGRSEWSGGAWGGRGR
jgi:hypothetical protein